METFKILQRLSETPGPSGFESEIAETIRAIWEPYVDDISIDRMGNLVALKRGTGSEPRRRLLIAAHMDEIGLMVHRIVEHQGYGFLRLTNLGGVDVRHLYGQLVTVHGQQQLTGVLGSLPGSMLPANRRSKAFGYEELFVDVGLPIKQVESNVSVGDVITFRQPLRQLLGKRVSGKALDNRASVTAVTGTLEYLNQRSHIWDVIAVATTQEETRLLGAFTSAYAQMPDAALAIDVTFGKGPGSNDVNTFELGSGPSLDLGPNVHTGIYNVLKEAAAALEMKVTTGTHTRGSGTDAFGLQVARSGVPTGLLSIPLRYMHTMVESVDLADVERCGRLMGEFAACLDDSFLDRLARELMGDDA